MPMDLATLIPSAISGLIGGLSASWISHRTVMRQIKAATQQQQDRLDHESTERRRDRDLDLRRNLYLEAADATFRAPHAFTVIADTDKPLEGMGFDPVTLAGLSKAHLVGRLETIKALDEVNITWGTEVINIFMARMSYEVLRADGADINTLMKARLDLMGRVVNATTLYGAAVARACVLVREELEQVAGFDTQAYERHVSESIARMRGLADQFAVQLGQFADGVPLPADGISKKS